MTKPATPEIERIKFKDLTINNLYSGRTEKEINENAKEKTKELEAAGGWNPAMPGQYFIGEDGAKHLLAGFSRVKASQINGEDSGYFVKVEGDEVAYLLACETTNSVRPLSTLARGARYSDLEKGVLSDDFDGAIADKKNPAHWKRMPMTQAAIAERIGKTSAWVQKCIAIFEAPPEIRDMIETDKIAVTIAEGSKSLVDKYHNGSEAKQIAICRRAFAVARAEDKETATKKHFESIRDEFIPEKKLVADGKKKDEKKGDQESGDGKCDETPELPSGGQESAPEREEEASTGDDELFKNSADTITEGTPKNKKLKEAWKTILMEPDNLEECTLEESTVDALVEKIHAAMVAARDVF